MNKVIELLSSDDEVEAPPPNTSKGSGSENKNPIENNCKEVVDKILYSGALKRPADTIATSAPVLKRVKPIQISKIVDKTVDRKSPIISIDLNSEDTINRKNKPNSLEAIDLNKITVKDSSEKEPLPTIKPAENSNNEVIIKNSILSLNNVNKNNDVSEKADPIVAAAKSDVIALEAPEKQTQSEEDSTPLNSDFIALLEACKTADPSDDMQTIIDTKLIKYYHSVHPDFVNSKGFCKSVRTITTEINEMPDLVYYKVKSIVEELKVRRKSKAAVLSNENVTTTGNELKDKQLRRLNKALYKITKRIARLEQADVDLEDDTNSTYLRKERYEKRACKIYDMICDLTGESKHAHRSVKKPISFHGTCYQKFNKTIQNYVNRTKVFPDYFDVLKCLEHCNNEYSFKLRKDEMKKIAQEAFIKIGKLLQDRRKSDLYETVTHFAGTQKDPALSDPTLNAKLSENQKHHAKIGNIIDRFAAEQELCTVEQQNKLKEKKSNEEILPTKNSENSGIDTLEKHFKNDSKTLKLSSKEKENCLVPNGTGNSPIKPNIAAERININSTTSLSSPITVSLETSSAVNRRRSYEDVEATVNSINSKETKTPLLKSVNSKDEEIIVIEEE